MISVVGGEAGAPVVLGKQEHWSDVFLGHSHNRLYAVSGWTRTSRQTGGLKVEKTWIQGWSHVDWKGFCEGAAAEH